MIRFCSVICLALFFLVAPFPLQAQERTEIDRAPLAAEIAERDVSFLAYDLESGNSFVLEGSALSERFTPWSTFKIPNLLIALETGVADSLDAKRTWDETRRPAADYWPKDWRQDQTLRTAFKVSAVWYFRDVALDVGTQKYRETLAQWNYGNAEVAEGSDVFWLDRTLKISVEEQIEFLTALLEGRLAVAASSLEALAVASLAGEAEELSLHGKTGAGPVESGNFDGAFEGWYVGFLMRPDRKPVVFALHARAGEYQALRSFRKDFAVRLLKEAGLLPATFPG